MPQELSSRLQQEPINKFEAQAATLEIRVSNTLTLLSGDRLLKPETRTQAGLFDVLEQHSISLDQITTESEDGSSRTLDYFKVAEEGRKVASDILADTDNGGKVQIINLIAGLCALRELVASHQAGAGKVIVGDGETRDAMVRIPVYSQETGRTEYQQTNIGIFDAVSEMLRRYDLDNIIQDINTGGADDSTDSRLAVASLLYTLSSPTQTLETAYSKTSIESGLTPMSYKEMLFLSQIDRVARKNRDANAEEIVKEFCTDDFGFLHVKGLYFGIENQGWGDNGGKIMRAVAITVAEDQTVYAITDQGEFWRKNREEKWEPFVIKRKNLSGGDEEFSVATTADLKNRTIEEIPIIENDNLYIDFRAVKTGKTATPRGDVIKFDQGSLKDIYDSQIAEKRKEIKENLEEIQSAFGIIEHLDENDYKTVLITREDGKKEEVVMIGKSEDLMTDKTKFPEIEDADSFPQIYIDQDGQVYSQLIKKTKDDRHVTVNLDKKGEKLIEVAQKDAIYYDTGLNISFLNLEENQPSEYFWTIESQKYQKGSNSFVLFRFLFDKSTYGDKTARFGVGFEYEDDGRLKRRSDEQYRTLDFVAKPKGEIASGQDEKVQTSFLERANTTFYKVRTGKEKSPVSTIPTTNLDKLKPDERKKRTTLGITKLRALKKQFGGQWDFVEGGEKEIYKKQPGERFAGKNPFSRRAKDVWIFAKTVDPKMPNATLLFDLDGNIFRKLSSGIIEWVQNGKPEKVLR